MKLFNKTRWLIIVVPILVLGLGYWSRTNFLVLAKNCYASFTYPFFKIQQSVISPLVDFIQSYQEQKKAFARLKMLEQENENLRARLIEAHASLDYVSEVQELVEYRKQFDELSGRIVKVLSRNLSEREHTVLIDRGSYHGIELDMVAVHKNCLVGRVSEVYPFYSKVTLITDKTCKVAAYCKNTKATGIHAGENSIQTSLQRVNHLSALEGSDAILSSGEGLIFPQGFLIGYIQEVYYDGVYKTARIKPAIDVTTLSCCIILQKGMPQALTLVAMQRDSEQRIETEKKT
jgi:rod shape-determining protein MreC